MIHIEEKLQDSEKKKLLKNMVICFISLLLAAVILFAPKIEFKKKTPEPEFTQMGKICELATLKCYYHNVVKYEKQPDGLFKFGYGKYGYKKMWQEYDGVVKVGIDAKDVKIYSPDKKNTVRIYVPDARVFEGADEEVNSISEPIVETGVFTKITIEEKNNAFSAAQEKMRKMAESDSTIKDKARENAIKLLTDYIKKVGKQINQEYDVQVID